MTTKSVHHKCINIRCALCSQSEFVFCIDTTNSSLLLFNEVRGLLRSYIAASAIARPNNDGQKLIIMLHDRSKIMIVHTAKITHFLFKLSNRKDDRTHFFPAQICTYDNKYAATLWTLMIGLTMY